MRRFLTGLMVLALAGPMPAAGAAPAPQCRFTAFFSDQDSSTNIRAAPSSTSKVIAKVDPASAVATLREARGGWFRVDSIVDYENDKPLFNGRGWVHASVIGIGVAGGWPKLYARPTTRSAVVQKLTPDGNILDLIDCRGDWVKVQVDKKKIGWMPASAQCSNPFTTCS